MPPLPPLPRPRATAATITRQQRQQHQRALVVLYRTALRLTRDLDQRLRPLLSKNDDPVVSISFTNSTHSSATTTRTHTTNLPPDIARICNKWWRIQPTKTAVVVAWNDKEEELLLNNNISTVQDLQRTVSHLFRPPRQPPPQLPQPPLLEPSQAEVVTAESVAKAIRGVGQLDRLVQHVIQQQLQQQQQDDDDDAASSAGGKPTKGGGGGGVLSMIPSSNSSKRDRIEFDLDKLLLTTTTTTTTTRRRPPPATKSNEEDDDKSHSRIVIVPSFLFDVDDSEDDDDDDDNDDNAGSSIDSSHSSSSSSSFAKRRMDERVQESVQQADEWARQWIESSGVEWLPSLVQPQQQQQGETADKKQTTRDVATAAEEEDDDDDDTDMTFPLFPVMPAEGFYQPNRPLSMFSSDVGHYESPIPGDSKVPLHIFEPRYLQLYNNEMMMKEGDEDKPPQSPQQTPSPQQQQNNTQFVVPFCHPCHPGTFATVGLLYECTHIQRVAEERDGENAPIRLLCQHDIRMEPVHITRIVNPEMYHHHNGQEEKTYMRVKGRKVLLGDDDASSPFLQQQNPLRTYSRLTRQLQSMIQSGHGFADKALHALHVGGMWKFVKLWTSCLQERLLQTELKLAAHLKLLKSKQQQEQEQQAAATPKKEKNDQQEDDSSSSTTTHDDDDDDDVYNDEKYLLRVQHSHRQNLLSLQLESALTIPRLLQVQQQHQQQQLNDDDYDDLQGSSLAKKQEDILLELVASEKERKPFPRRL